MAKLDDRMILSLSDLEEQLGTQRLPEFVAESERGFVEKTHAVAEHIKSHQDVRIVFVSGPTSSGKTTFTHRLVQSLSKMGRPSLQLSLDDYYDIDHLHFDDDGRPDYESIHTMDTEQASRDICDLLSGARVLLHAFDFHTRTRICPPGQEPATLPENGIILVEGLHGLSPEIAGKIGHEKWLGVFIMPWGEIVSDRRLVESQDIRLLRRIIRDVRRRGAHALATIDYWPMIVASESDVFDQYLARADYYINSLLAYETMVTAPLARNDIARSLRLYATGELEPSTFLDHHVQRKGYADLPLALQRAKIMVRDLSTIPAIDPALVPEQSILQEFI